MARAGVPRAASAPHVRQRVSVAGADSPPAALSAAAAADGPCCRFDSRRTPGRSIIPLPHFKEKPMVRLAAACCVLALSISPVAHAQTFRGSIAGRVADQTGGVLPGVTVTATNDATGVSRTTVSSDTGDFSIPDLQLG